MEKKEKKPELTQNLIDRCTSEEAVRDIIKIENEYNKAKEKLDETLLERNANMFMIKGTKTVTPEFEKLERDIQREMPEKLKEHYLEKAQAVFEKYHPKSPAEKTEDFRTNAEDIYIKGFNHGYELSKHEPELSDKLIENIRDISLPYTDGFKDGKVQYNREILIDKLHERDKEKSAENIPGKENRDFDKKQDLPRDRDI